MYKYLLQQHSRNPMFYMFYDSSYAFFIVKREVMFLCRKVCKLAAQTTKIRVIFNCVAIT